MKIIISPAKKMITNNHLLDYKSEVILKNKTKVIMDHIKNMPYDEAKNMWNCNDKIAKENFERFKNMDLDKNLSPAILSYEGIQYKYMGKEVFSCEEYEYLQEHLRILSGFYGVLRPFDGIVPYRLEMQAKIYIFHENKTNKNLYEYWGKSIYDEISAGEKQVMIVNLASLEYSKAVSKYLDKKDKMINCHFATSKNGRLTVKATEAKMARGSMVRFMAENKVKDTEKLKEFSNFGFAYNHSLSDEKNLFFVKDN